MGWAFDYYKKMNYDQEHYAMPESSYPFNSGTTPDDVKECLYLASKAAKVSVKKHDYIGFLGSVAFPSFMKAALKQ